MEAPVERSLENIKEAKAKKGKRSLVGN